jgi:hypothetical protein
MCLSAEIVSERNKAQKVDGDITIEMSEKHCNNCYEN